MSSSGVRHGALDITRSSAVGPASVDDTYSDPGESSPPPPPSPILTAGSDDPKCVN